MKTIEEIKCERCRNIWTQYAKLAAYMLSNLTKSISERNGHDDVDGDVVINNLKMHYTEALDDLILFTQWKITDHVHDASQQNLSYSQIVQLAEIYSMQKFDEMK